MHRTAPGQCLFWGSKSFLAEYALSIAQISVYLNSPEPILRFIYWCAVYGYAIFVIMRSTSSVFLDSEQKTKTASFNCAGSSSLWFSCYLFIYFLFFAVFFFCSCSYHLLHWELWCHYLFIVCGFVTLFVTHKPNGVRVRAYTHSLYHRMRFCVQLISIEYNIK